MKTSKTLLFIVLAFISCGQDEQPECEDGPVKNVLAAFAPYENSQTVQFENESGEIEEFSIFLSAEAEPYRWFTCDIEQLFVTLDWTWSSPLKITFQEPWLPSIIISSDSGVNGSDRPGGNTLITSEDSFTTFSGVTYQNVFIAKCNTDFECGKLNQVIIAENHGIVAYQNLEGWWLLKE